MHKRMALNGLALIGLLASTTVLAETQPGFYVGAGVGKATTEIDDDGTTEFDSDDTAFRVFGGYNFNQHFALEAAYFDGGAPEETVIAVPGARGTIDISTTGLIASVLGRVPVGEIFSVYGKVGLASFDNELKGRVNGDVVTEADDSDDGVAYGVGAAFNIGPSFELRAEYEAFSGSFFDSDIDVTALTVNALYKF
jgi:OmpA-OmpF porin, OOP family